jgi:hypothetical protein
MALLRAGRQGIVEGHRGHGQSNLSVRIDPMWAALVIPLAILAVDPGVPGGTGAGRPALPEPIATRQAVFIIPFHVQKAADPSREPAEVQLHFSADQGATWRLYDKAEPAQGHFLFRAAGDGEYWFVVRTVDRSGQIRPLGISGPELRVIVDTTPPNLQLKVQRGPDGQITAQWDINEIRLKAGSFLLQYRVGADRPWETVAIGPNNHRIDHNAQVGEVTWWPRATNGTLQVRAEVADEAGNPAISHAQVELGSPPAIAHNNATAVARPPDSGPALARSGDTTGPWRPSADRPAGGQAVAVQPPLQPAPVKSVPQPAQNPPAVAMNSKPGAGAVPGPVAMNAHPAVQNQYLSMPNPASPQASTQHPWAQSPPAQYASLERASLPAVGLPSSPPQYPSSSALTAPAPAQPAASAQPPVSAGLGGANALRPRMINSRVFQLDYVVPTLGPSGIGSVELWGTRDGGQNWSRFAVDDGKHNPLVVSVDQEAIYGFRVVVRNGAGVGGEPPKRGDAPDVLVGVDLTPPAAKFLDVQQGRADQIDQLFIAWEATDRALRLRPITLSFSPSPAGPWTRIAGELENSGRYVWQVGRAVPERLYLRLEVVDEAGNMTTCDRPEVVIFDRVHPQALIRDVRAMPPAAGSPAR